MRASLHSTPDRPSTDRCVPDAKPRCAALLWLLLTAALLGAGCAGGTVDPSDNDDTTPDMDGTGSDMDAPGDDMGTPPVDMGTDAGATDMPSCGACCPGETTCLDGATQGVCRQDGSGYEMTDCSASDQICEQGSCVDEPVCTPGETECFDATTRLICRPGGTGYRSEACSGDTSCFEGSCVSGSITGAACSADGDCLGGTCKCGDQSAESCAAGLEPAYCTTRCPSGSCAGDDLCFASEVFSWGSADSTYDHCIPSCNVDCEAQGMTCRDVPVYDDDGTSIIWERGCFYDQLGDVGDECDADTDCISGTCLEGYFSTGYCTLRCEDRGCPGDTACVELRTGEQWCSLKCINDAGTEKCPLDLPDDRIDASCGTRISQKSGVAVDVCISTN